MNKIAGNRLSTYVEKNKPPAKYFRKCFMFRLFGKIARKNGQEITPAREIQKILLRHGAHEKLTELFCKIDGI